MCLFTFSIACSNVPNCASINIAPQIAAVHDTKNLPFNSFVTVRSKTFERTCTPSLALTSTAADVCPINIRIASASGVVIYKSIHDTGVAYVLTAKHMCNTKQEIKGDVINHQFVIKDFNYDSYEALSFVKSDASDSCILIFAHSPDWMQPVEITETEPSLGERVFNLAAPESMSAKQTMMVFEGFYSGIYEDYHIFTLPASQGSSGSPIFNKENQLVGMIFAVPTSLKDERLGDSSTRVTKQTMENLAYAVGIDDIKALVTVLVDVDANIDIGSIEKN